MGLRPQSRLPRKHNCADPDDYEPAETIVLDELPLMETVEFRRLVTALEELLDDIEPLEDVAPD